MGTSKIRLFIINTMKKSNFYFETAQGNRPNFIFRDSLISIIVARFFRTGKKFNIDIFSC
jgi:hypothetical protein